MIPASLPVYVSYFWGFGQVFTDWVSDQIEERNEEVTVKKGLEIELDPDIAAAFHTSTSVSRKCISSFKS